MATRFYYVANTTPGITPTPDASWNSTTGMVRRTMSTSQAATTEQLQVDLGATGPTYTCHVQLVSPPLDAQTITGTVSVVSRGREMASTDNVNKRARSVRVFSGDGSTLRGTLNAWAATTSTTELSPTTLQGQSHASGAAITSVVCQAGDVIVVEVGYGVNTSGTTPQATMEWGGTGTDHANANSDATGTVPWIEFSANLVFQSGDATATPSTVAAVAAVPAPTPSASSTATPAAVAAVAAVAAPTPSGGGGDATVTAAVVAAATSIPAPTVSAGSLVSASVVAGVAAIPSPTVRASSTASPSTVAGTASVPSVTVSAGSNPTPATVAAVAAVPTPTVSAGGSATATPTVVAAAASIPAPTLSAGSRLTPAVVTGAASVPAPTVRVHVTVTLTTVAGVAAIATPTVSAQSGVTVTPAVVMALASVPSPSVSGIVRNLDLTAGQPQAAWHAGTPALGWTADDPSPAWRASSCATRWDAESPDTTWRAGTPTT